LEKFKLHGINGKLLKWIQSFLEARLMRVGIRGSFSDWIEMLSGVPRGSVLGPLLFLLFVNDLPDWIKNSMITEEKDLGVYITADFKPSTQCVRAAAKARSVMGKVRRNFRRLDKEDFLLIYKTYIRPHMEYCVQAWPSYIKKDIECFEKVQRSATKMVHGLRHLSYEQRLQHLELITLGLRERRIRGDLIETFKIMTGKERVDRSQFFQFSTCEYQLRGHTMKLSKQRTSLDARKYSFSQRVVQEWNKLSQDVVEATSVNQFKNRLDKFWQRYGH